MTNENNNYIPFRFKVSGNIIRKLGEESISNKNIAILELIKNSYDANSKKVEINLNEIDTTNASITISDNGDGMGSSEIENKWMNIATPNKSKIIKINNGERIPVGEKGIGRLSSESLGKRTILYTYPKNETKGYKIIFNWEEYQKPNVLCNEVINKGYEFKKKKKECGTKIEIKDLKHDWNDIDIQKSLLRDIYLLNPPNKSSKNFKIIPKFHKEVKQFKKIRKNFLNKASFYLKTKIISGNRIQYEFVTITGKKKKDTIVLDKKLSCGDAVFELFFYYKNSKYLKDALNYEMSKQDIKEINDTLKEYHGIKIYRDNFRVKPYGEPGNDWAELDLFAQNNTMSPRNNAIFGMVHISKSKNPKIIDTTTREGVIANQEFQDLTRFVQISIRELFIDLRSDEESHKKKARQKTKTGKKKKAKSKPTLVKVPEVITEPLKEDKFIDIKGDYPDKFYYPLEEEINECYKNGYLNATFFLSRKLVENLLYNILEKKFPKKEDEEIWWNKEFNQPLTLSPLIRNLYNNRSDFPSNIKRYIEKVKKLLDKIRNEINPKAHNIYDYISSKEELDKFKINDSVQLLIKIYNLIQPIPPTSQQS